MKLSASLNYGLHNKTNAAKLLIVGKKTAELRAYNEYYHTVVIATMFEF